jgi:poly(A) polymerase
MVATSRETNREEALHVLRALKKAGYTALLAGGSVRDRLLGREPLDYDVATSATPAEVMGMFPRVKPVGVKYGVVLVLVGENAVEVATFRRDSVYGDGRRPDSVAFSVDPAEDAQRRDFTINGLFLDPDTDEVLDFVGGREDLDRGIVRAIGIPEERFAEDRLRMLRAVRFSCALGFDIADTTFVAIGGLAPLISSVSGERIRDELLKILTGPEPGRGLRLLQESGLLAGILPEIAAMVGVAQPEQFHPEGDVFTHTCLVLDHLRAPRPILALAALLHDVGKPPTFVVKERIRFDRHPQVGAEMAEVICRRLRMSRRETEEVCELVHDHLKFMSIKDMREARLRRFLTTELAEDHLELHRADCLGCHRKLSNYEFALERRAEFLASPPPRQPLLSGKDLIELGLTPGPLFAEILTEVEDQRLEGHLMTREQALQWVRSETWGE